MRSFSTQALKGALNPEVQFCGKNINKKGGCGKNAN